MLLQVYFPSGYDYFNLHSAFRSSYSDENGSPVVNHATAVNEEKSACTGDEKKRRGIVGHKVSDDVVTKHMVRGEGVDCNIMCKYDRCDMLSVTNVIR